jgi:hypothetical protein
VLQLIIQSNLILRIKRLALVSNHSTVVVETRRNARRTKITSSTAASMLLWSGIVHCSYMHLPSLLQKLPHLLSHLCHHFHRNQLHLPHQVKIPPRMK